jgi:hypothetical protein
MSTPGPWETYDPTWLVELARKQLPEQTALIEALANCTRVWKRTPTALYFVDPTRPNVPGSEWQFADNYIVDSARGEVSIDVLEDGRVGGIEIEF